MNLSIDNQQLDARIKELEAQWQGILCGLSNPEDIHPRGKIQVYISLNQTRLAELQKNQQEIHKLQVENGKLKKKVKKLVKDNENLKKKSDNRGKTLGYYGAKIKNKKDNQGKSEKKIQKLTKENKTLKFEIHTLKQDVDKCEKELKRNIKKFYDADKYEKATEEIKEMKKEKNNQAHVINCEKGKVKKLNSKNKNLHTTIRQLKKKNEKQSAKIKKPDRIMRINQNKQTKQLKNLRDEIENLKNEIAKQKEKLKAKQEKNKMEPKKKNKKKKRDAKKVRSNKRKKY